MYNISVFWSVCVGWEVPCWGAPGFLYCLLRPEYGYKREVPGSQAFQLLLVRFPSSGTAYLPGFLSHLIMSGIHSVFIFLTYLNVNLFAHIAYVLKPDWGELYPEQNSQGCLEGEISRGAEVHTCFSCHTGGGCAAVVARALAAWWEGKRWPQGFQIIAESVPRTCLPFTSRRCIWNSYMSIETCILSEAVWQLLVT